MWDHIIRGYEASGALTGTFGSEAAAARTLEILNSRPFGRDPYKRPYTSQGVNLGLVSVVFWDNDMSVYMVAARSMHRGLYLPCMPHTYQGTLYSPFKGALHIPFKVPGSLSLESRRGRARSPALPARDSAASGPSTPVAKYKSKGSGAL